MGRSNGLQEFGGEVTCCKFSRVAAALHLLMTGIIGFSLEAESLSPN